MTNTGSSIIWRNHILLLCAFVSLFCTSLKWQNLKCPLSQHSCLDKIVATTELCPQLTSVLYRLFSHNFSEFHIFNCLVSNVLRFIVHVCIQTFYRVAGLTVYFNYQHAICLISQLTASRWGFLNYLLRMVWWLLGKVWHRWRPKDNCLQMEHLWCMYFFIEEISFFAIITSI